LPAKAADEQLPGSWCIRVVAKQQLPGSCGPVVGARVGPEVRPWVVAPPRAPGTAHRSRS